MKTETLKTIIRLLDSVVSQDETRYSLTCVEVTPTHLNATDGHIMAACLHKDDFFKGITKNVYIGRDKLAILKVWLKDFKRMPEIFSASLEGAALFVNGLKVSQEEIKYPDVTKFSQDYPKTFKVGLNPELLLDLAKGLSDSKVKGCALEFKVIEESEIDDCGATRLTGFKVDATNPIKVTASNGNGGVLMPMRI